MSEHHPSCRESDKDLVWHCVQCGLNESVSEQDLEEMVTEAIKKGHFMPEGKKWPMSEQPQEFKRGRLEWAIEAAKEIVAMPMINEYLVNEVAEIIERHGNAACAAEQKKVNQVTVERDLARISRESLTEELATEQKRADKAAARAELAQIELAAEQGKVRVLVDAMREIANSTNSCVANAALAKVKEAQ